VFRVASHLVFEMHRSTDPCFDLRHRKPRLGEGIGVDESLGFGAASTFVKIIEQFGNLAPPKSASPVPTVSASQARQRSTILPSSNKGHLRGHDGHELNVGV